MTIQLHDVHKSWGRRRALQDVNLLIRPGVTGVLGANGAGKTTLLRLAATSVTPSRGSVEVLGLDAREEQQRGRIRRSLGYVPQGCAFTTAFTIWEYLDYLAVLKQIDDRKERQHQVRRVLLSLDLEAHMHERIRDLSGGTRRRLVLAQALLGKPQVLVLDEPTVGLDPEQRLQYWDRLTTLAHQPTILLSTHATQDVERLCDQVVVLDSGRVVFDGKPAELTALAIGRVWTSQTPPVDTATTWRTADGLFRHVGDPPPGADLEPPMLADGYLLLLRSPAAA